MATTSRATARGLTPGPSRPLTSYHAQGTLIAVNFVSNRFSEVIQETVTQGGPAVRQWSVLYRSYRGLHESTDHDDG